MPVIESQFRAPFFLRNGHAQTIGSVLLSGKRPPGSTIERLELADGDFLDLIWSRHANADRLAVLCHGLEGNASQNYIRRMSATLFGAGWDVLAWNFRGCTPGEPNRLSRFYHSGETEDLRRVLEHAESSYAGLALVGFSLGANVMLKYLGEKPPHKKVVAAVAVSAPVELAASTRIIDHRWGNRIYLRRFLKTLTAKVEAKALQFPDCFDLGGIRQTRSFLEFDDRYTARVHGFRDAADYWAQSSARQFLPTITVPTLMLSAQDDPFLPAECFPRDEAKASTALTLEAPAHGGHTAFIDWSTLQGGPTWAERRAREFLTQVVG